MAPKAHAPGHDKATNSSVPRARSSSPTCTTFSNMDEVKEFLKQNKLTMTKITPDEATRKAIAEIVATAQPAATTTDVDKVQHHNHEATTAVSSTALATATDDDKVAASITSALSADEHAPEPKPTGEPQDDKVISPAFTNYADDDDKVFEPHTPTPTSSTHVDKVASQAPAAATLEPLIPTSATVLGVDMPTTQSTNISTGSYKTGSANLTSAADASQATEGYSTKSGWTSINPPTYDDDDNESDRAIKEEDVDDDGIPAGFFGLEKKKRGSYKGRGKKTTNSDDDQDHENTDNDKDHKSKGKGKKTSDDVDDDQDNETVDIGKGRKSRAKGKKRTHNSDDDEGMDDADKDTSKKRKSTKSTTPAGNGTPVGDMQYTKKGVPIPTFSTRVRRADRTTDPKKRAQGDRDQPKRQRTEMRNRINSNIDAMRLGEAPKRFFSDPDVGNHDFMRVIWLQNDQWNMAVSHSPAKKKMMDWAQRATKSTGNNDEEVIKTTEINWVLVNEVPKPTTTEAANARKVATDKAAYAKVASRLGFDGIQDDDV